MQFVNKFDPEINSIIIRSCRIVRYLLFHYFLFGFLLNLSYYMLPHDHYYKLKLIENIVLQNEYLLYTKSKQYENKSNLSNILRPFHRYCTKSLLVHHRYLYMLKLLKNKLRSYRIVERENNIRLYW